MVLLHDHFYERITLTFQGHLGIKVRHTSCAYLGNGWSYSKMQKCFLSSTPRVLFYASRLDHLPIFKNMTFQSHLGVKSGMRHVSHAYLRKGNLGFAAL